MGVKGGFAELDRLQRKLAAVANGTTLRGLSQALAYVAITEVRDGFDTSEAPDGSGWAALKHRVGKPLLINGALRDSISATSITADGFTLASSKHYAQYHQTGTRYMPARMMWPDGDLPKKWDDAMRARSIQYIKDYFARR